MTILNVKLGVKVAVNLLLFCVLFDTALAARRCTREDAINAEVSASSLKTWRDAYLFYRRYKQCDDGAISEGYSASVADLLAAHWDRVGDFDKLSSAHPDFERFVIHHIDETMTQEQGDAIKDNVSRKCPMGARHTCGAIKARFVELGSR